MSRVLRVSKQVLNKKRETGGYECPKCHHSTAVVDSRSVDTGIRRRRHCVCGHRFSTYECELGHAPDFLELLDSLARKSAGTVAEAIALHGQIERLLNMSNTLRELDESRRYPNTKKD